MEQWDYQQDLTRFEIESDAITLRLLNWEKYLDVLYESGRIFFTTPPTYRRLLTKPSLEKEDEDEDEDEDENDDGDSPQKINRSIIFSHKASDKDEIDKDDDDDDEDDIKTRKQKDLSFFRAVKQSDIMNDILTNWITAYIPGYKYEETRKYSLRHFYRIRYIQTHKSKLPHSIEFFSDKYFDRGLLADKSSKSKYTSKTTYTEYYVKMLQPVTGVLFDSFAKEQRRHLDSIFDVIFKENFLEDLLGDNKEHKFNESDCQFFSFLLNTYYDNEGENFRQQNFINVASSYLDVIKIGIINLIQTHPKLSYIDPYIIFAKWDLKKAKQTLNKTIDVLIQNPLEKQFSEEKLLEMADQIDQLNEKIQT